MDRKSVGAGASVKVAILGFGTVGTSAARILCEHPPQGVELSCIFNRGIDRKRVPWIPSSVLWTESFDQVLASNADIVVELAGGLNPAGDWVRQSLARERPPVLRKHAWRTRWALKRRAFLVLKTGSSLRRFFGLPNLLTSSDVR